MFAKLPRAPVVAQKPKRKTRPVFDESEIGQAFKLYFETRQKPLEPISAIILKTLFGNVNYRAVADEIFQNVKNSKAVCAKIFTPKDIAFKCFDCEKDPTCIICKECYEKGNHKGHRVQVQKSVSGCCDCGDPDAWNEDGFCSDHPGYANFKPTYSVEDIPENFRESFITVFEKCFFFLFHFYEEYAITKKADQAMELEINDLTTHILSALFFCGERSMALWLLLCQLFRTKLSERNRELYANTENLKETAFHEVPKVCDFTYFETWLYYHSLNHPNIQKKIEEICIKLFADYQFKIYLAESYIKMIYFIFPLWTLPDPQQPAPVYIQSRITGLNVQLFTAEEFAIIGINSPYFPAFLDLFRDILSWTTKNSNMNSFETVMEFYSFFHFASQKQPSRKRLVESGVFITRILDWLDLMNDCFRLNTVNKPSLNPQDIENTALLMDIEYKLLQIVDSIFAELNALEDQQFKARQIEEITEMFVNRIKKNDIDTFKNRENHDKYRSLSIPFYRAFGLYIKNLLEEPTIAALERLIKETMKISDRNMEIIAHFLFKTTLRTVTFPIDNEKKAWEFHSPLFDLFSSMYRNPKLKFLDCDIIVLQISLVFIHAEDFCLALQSSASANPMFRKIFGPLHTGKFNTEKFQELIPDLHKALENTPEKQEKRAAPALKLFKKEETQPIEYRIDTLLDEFFNILIMLCTDGVAFANLFHQKNKMFEEVKHPAFCKSVYTDVIINVFQKQNKMAYKTLKEILSNRIINEKADIETSLNEVATFNSTTKTFIIKDKYTEIYEPFTFIRDPQLLVETHESIQARLKTNKLANDLVIGQSSYIYEYKHSIPNRIQENVFSFPIVEFAVDCLIQSKEMSKNSSLINRPVLKFLHMALNFALHFKNEKLIQKMAGISENKLFTERLKELKADPTCPEVSPAIDAIMQLLGQIQKLCSIQGVEPMEVVAEGDTDKHNKQLEANKTRMQAIKAQFSQKREAFLKKFKTEIEDDTATEEELLCCICRSKMTDETEYGIPAFFGESSLYNLAFCKSKNKLQGQAIQEEEETKEDLTNLQNLPKEAFKPYPVVTSCSHSLHYIHKECFEKHSRARTGSNVGFVYGNDLEYSCSLCKSLCNVFIPKKISKAITDQDKVEGIEVELTNMKDLVEYIETVNAVPHNSEVQPDSLFNDIMLLEVINDNICKRLSENVANEDFIIDKFDNLFGQCCQTVTFGGLQYFIKHKYSVYKPLVEAYRQFYVSHSSQTKGVYYDKQKMLLSKYLQLLLFGLPQAIQTDDDTLLFRDAASTKIPLLATPDEFIFQALQHILIASKLSTKMASELTSKVMRVYLVHRMVQVYIKDKLQKGGSEEISYENFIKDLSLSNNSPIKEEVTNGLLPSVRKVVVFILLNSNIEEAALAGFTKDFTNDEQEINQYLMIKGLETTIADLLSPKAFEYAGIPEESIKNWIETAKVEFKGFNSLTPYVKMVDRDVVFSFTELPENYYDLSTTYIEKKCQMCKDHPQMGNRCVCLLCDMVLCSIVCTKRQIQRNQELGNLNTHSMMHHAGECAFLNVETGRIYLLKTPKNVDYCPLYVDRFGYGLQEEKARDWRSYKLDKACLDNLREKFVYEKVAQEVSYNITNNSKKLYDSLL